MVGQLSRCRVMHAHGLMGLEYTLSVKGVEIPRRRVGQMRHRNLVVVLLCSLRPAVRLEWPTPGASTCIQRKFHANLLKRTAGFRGTHRAAMQPRSEERRVGKAWFRKWKSRWLPDH